MKNTVDYEFFKKLTSLPYVEKIYLFGSRAKGIADERADIDLAIECPRASDKNWSQVLEIIENADTLLQIDCVRLDQVKSKKFKDAILKDHKILYLK